MQEFASVIFISLSLHFGSHFFFKVKSVLMQLLNAANLVAPINQLLSKTIYGVLHRRPYVSENSFSIVHCLLSFSKKGEEWTQRP